MMETYQTLTKTMQTLGFRLIEDDFQQFLNQATQKKWSPEDICTQLFLLEKKARDVRNLQTRMKAACLGKYKPLDQFDWNFPRRISRDLYRHLISLEFIQHCHNVLLRGPSGVGKTMLAKNLGLLAVQKGYHVRFTTLAMALADISRQDTLAAIERRINLYVKPHLLIIDEIGYIPCDNRSADILFNIISRRHEQKPTIISTNLPFKQWNTIFPGAACVAAMIDRFMQHCHVMDIDGNSWREKESQEFSEKHKKLKPPLTKEKKA